MSNVADKHIQQILTLGTAYHTHSAFDAQGILAAALGKYLTPCHTGLIIVGDYGTVDGIYVYLLVFLVKIKIFLVENDILLVHIHAQLFKAIPHKPLKIRKKNGII